MSDSTADADEPGAMPRALITGASSGIGTELARCAAADRHAVALTARSADRLDELAAELRAEYGVPVTTVPLDLVSPDAPELLFARLQELDWLPLDVLVNNAGFGGYGPFCEADSEHTRAMLRLNIEALTALTHRSLPGMRERGRGHVLNVASTAAFQPGPLMAVYYATKAYVLSFSEALAEELRGCGVKVTALCPGITESEFQTRAGMESARMLRAVKPMTAARVASYGWRAMLRGKVVAVPGWANKIGTIAVRWMPRALVRRVVKKLQGPAPSKS